MNRVTPRVTMYVRGRPVLVSRPDGSSQGRLSVDMLATLAQARADRMTACFIRPPMVANESLLALTTDEVPVVQCDGIAWAGLLARWGLTAFAERGMQTLRTGTASFWREFGREIRRHASDERVPAAFRARLREVAQRSLARSTVPDHCSAQYPRRLLRDRVRTSLPQVLLKQAQRTADALGIAIDSPIVALDAKSGTDALADARAFLVRHGYTIVQVGDTSPLLEVFILLLSRFVICGSVELQQVACLTNTASLTLNASDPFIGYPVREDGLYTLKKVIDLDTGRVLTSSDLLRETYFQNLRNCGYRDNTSAEVLEAVREMHEGVSHGWQESQSQARFRERVTEAGSALAGRVPHVAEWGPDRGFIGDGRLARFQADEAR